ncbi:MAG: hypothetical protein FWC27_05795, partial [Firmicutes bacterium]|nr:hypothetical protein [Bacillota bacterium]
RGIEVAVCKVADMKEETYAAVQAFSGAGADFTNLTNAKNIALAAALDAYASAAQYTRASKVTDINGNAVFTGLTAGLYLVAQVNGGSSEYIINPYLISVLHDAVTYPKSVPVRHSAETILKPPGTVEEPVIPGELDSSTPGKSGQPKTEDTSDMLLWIALMTFCFIGLIVVLVVMRKKRGSRVYEHGPGGIM